MTDIYILLGLAVLALVGVGFRAGQIYEVKRQLREDYSGLVERES